MVLASGRKRMSVNRTSSPRERVLAVGGELIDLVEPYLAECPLHVERVVDGRTAILLARKMRYEHLVVGFPLPDMGLAVFVDHLRRAESASPTARLLMVTDDRHMAAAEAYRDEGFIAEAVSVEMDSDVLSFHLTNFMKTAPRVAARLDVRVHAVGALGEETIVGQTVNYSESGMLMRCDRCLERGTKVRFELLGDRGREPIVGSAVVVRSARIDLEGVTGMGIRFASFEGDGRTRLAVGIRSRLAEFVG